MKRITNLMKKNNWYRSYSISDNFTLQTNDQIGTLFIDVDSSDRTITLDAAVTGLSQILAI